MFDELLIRIIRDRAHGWAASIDGTGFHAVGRKPIDAVIAVLRIVESVGSAAHEAGPEKPPNGST